MDTLLVNNVNGHYQSYQIYKKSQWSFNWQALSMESSLPDIVNEPNLLFVQPMHNSIDLKY